MKVINYLVMGLTTLSLSCSFFNFAEATNVVLLPLINRTTEYEDFGQIYYNRAINVMKLNDEYTLVDDTKTEEIVAKYTAEAILPDENACHNIAKATDADIVIAMEMNKLDVIELPSTKMNDDILLQIKGTAVSYNRLTGKFLKHSISDENKMRGAFFNRYDLPASLFGDNVTREIKKALNIRKVTLETPKIGSLKGDRR